ncbi:MAG: glutamate formimidoyltransferase [Bacteroidia bacterium]
MKTKLLECVPNFSEGRDTARIQQIAEAIEMVAGVKLLNIDSGKAANRTVMTFAGEPQAVAEAAFQAIQTAAEVIDMRQQKGAHPRMGATDVCPFIPLNGCTMAEAVGVARAVAKRVGEELMIPVFLYEEAALQKGRTNLSRIRRGEYEGMAAKMQQPGWEPDFGPGELNPKTGASVIGARDFLIAYNINLNTTSAEKAHEVAEQIRESGRRITSVHPETGEQQHEMVPGTLKKVKALGWFIEEYGLAQISMNLTHFHTTSIHQAFDEATRVAEEMGLRVTGSEIVGMVPLEVMKLAGEHYYRKQGMSSGVSDEALVEMAIRSLGLNDSVEFDPNQKIIEWRLRNLEES